MEERETFRRTAFCFAAGFLSVCRLEWASASWKQAAHCFHYNFKIRVKR